MPTYDYVCQACDHAFEEFQSITSNPMRKCPACGKLKLKRLIGTGSGVIFKGSGFYETDYRSDSYKKGAKAEKDATSGSKSKSDKDGGASKGADTSTTSGDSSSDTTSKGTTSKDTTSKGNSDSSAGSTPKNPDK